MNKSPLLAVLFASALLRLPLAHAAEVADTWGHNCAACHGKDGAGHTKAGKKLGVKDLTDATYQKTFDDSKAFDDIKKGAKDKDGNDLMKPFADKLSDDEIKGLVAYVRTLQK
jgi:mono/diheme cytochrome c family protein